MPQVYGWPWAKMAKGKCGGLTCRKELTMTPLGKHVLTCKALRSNWVAPAQVQGAAGNLSDRVVTIMVISKPHFLLLQVRGDATVYEVCLCVCHVCVGRGRRTEGNESRPEQRPSFPFLFPFPCILALMY
jgi:hypothetical protein